GPADTHFLRNGQAPEPVPGTDRVKCPQSVGSQRKGSPGRLKRRCALADGDVPASQAQPCCRRQAADPGTDHNRTRSCHPGALVRLDTSTTACSITWTLMASPDRYH